MVIINTSLVFAEHQSITVKQPLTTGQVTKLVSLDELKKIIVSEYDPTYDWDKLVVHITSLNWAANKIILRAENPYSGPDLLWSIDTDGNGLKRIYSNDTLLENLRHPPNDLGDITVWVPQCDKCPNFTIMLGTRDNSYQQVLYNATSTPEYPAISSDGRYVAFASEANSSWDNPKEDGIYLITLSTPVPEFPFMIPILLISITSLILFYRMRIIK